MPVKQAVQILTYGLLFCTLASFLLACDITPNLSSVTPPTDTLNSPLNQWLQIAPGLEIRYEHWKSAGPDEDTVTISRFDLHYFHIGVGYQPSQPLSLATWQQQTGAVAVFNGGYFDQHNRATGLVISDGQSYGTTYPDFGGLLAVDAQGNVILRSLSRQPYDPTEELQQATESSPMLVLDGKRTQFNANASSSRRTVVALDTAGRLLFILSPGSTLTLDEMADVLSSSGLQLETALNLDGGASTGMSIKTNSQNITIDSISTLPIVIYLK